MNADVRKKTYTTPGDFLLAMKEENPDLYKKVVEVVNKSKGKYMSEDIPFLLSMPGATADSVIECLDKIVDEAEKKFGSLNGASYSSRYSHNNQYDANLYNKAVHILKGTSLYWISGNDPHKSLDEYIYRSPYSYQFKDTYLYRALTECDLIPEDSPLHDFGGRSREVFFTTDSRRLITRQERDAKCQHKSFAEFMRDDMGGGCWQVTFMKPHVDSSLVEMMNGGRYGEADEIFALKQILCAYKKAPEDIKKLLTSSDDKLWFWGKSGHWNTGGYYVAKASKDVRAAWFEAMRECYVRELYLAARVDDDVFKSLHNSADTIYRSYRIQCLVGCFSDTAAKAGKLADYEYQLELEDTLTALEYMDIAILSAPSPMHQRGLRPMMKHICSVVRSFRSDVRKGLAIEDVRAGVVEDLNEWATKKTGVNWHFAVCRDAKKVLPDLKSKKTLKAEELKKATLKAAMAELHLEPIEDEDEYQDEYESDL